MKTLSEFREERNATICDALRQGVSVPDLSAEFHISMMTIRSIASFAGIKPASIAKQKRNAAIAVAVRAGATAEDLMLKFGIALTQLKKVVKEAGLPPFPRQPRQQPMPRRYEHTEKILEALRAGEDRASIARRFNLSLARIYQIASRYGIAFIRQARKSDAIAALIEAGHTAREINERTGCHTTRVYMIAKERGLMLTKARPSSRTFVILAEVLNTSHKLAEIAEHNEATIETVAQIISQARAAGIRIPSRRGNRWRNNGRSKEKRAGVKK